MYDLIINDTFKCKEYGLIIANRVDIPIAIREYETISIDGRDGVLTKELGYADREIEVNFNFFKFRNMPRFIRNVTPLLLSAKTLIFSDDTEVSYKVKKVEMDDIARQIRHYGSFTVKFTVEPFSYLNCIYETTKTIVNNKIEFTLLNQGTHESLPYIRINGNGTIKLKVNDETVTLSKVDGHIEIDSDVMECYKDDILMNNFMNGNFPILKTGSNTISVEGNASEIIINPRWRCL